MDLLDTQLADDHLRASHQPRIFTAHPLLRNIVDCFWLAERVFTPERDHFMITPDRSIEFIVSVGAPCTVEDDAVVITLSRCYLVGLLERSLQLRATGTVRTLGARLAPWACATLLRDALPPRRARRGVIDGLFPELAERVAGALASSAEEAVRTLEQFLITRVIAPTGGDAAIARAVDQIIAERGDLDIEALARATGVSGRTLRRSFGVLLGVAPKHLAQLAQFQHVRDALWEQPDVALADLALEAGYADQAHMQRAFRRFSGRTPRQFAADVCSMRAQFDAPVGRKLQSSGSETRYP